jgi:hypothetical protein
VRWVGGCFNRYCRDQEVVGVFVRFHYAASTSSICAIKGFQFHELELNAECRVKLHINLDLALLACPSLLLLLGMLVNLLSLRQWNFITQDKTLEMFAQF